ncbi:hypothetical protein ACWCOW_41850 [Streptomyces sp. NPDC001939]
MPIEPQRGRSSAQGEPQPKLPFRDPAEAWDHPLRSVETSLDSLAKRYPDREVSVGRRRKKMEFYGKPDEPNGFAMDSLEFFFLIAQYFREALPLRAILLLIACQRAGGVIRLTQEEMSTVLDVSRTKLNEALNEIMSHGIVFKVRRGVYQFNPPYSYRVAEFIPGTETAKPEWVEVDQRATIQRIRADESLPNLVRFPSLEKMREDIQALREERARDRARRRLERALKQGKGKGTQE